MDSQPHIKFEHSPADSLADSFVSTPGTAYPPLFHDTMNPSEVMTPQSYDENSMFGGSMDGSMAGSPPPAPEKKPVKKRKSWGQQLPEPKTNLPPRKRAKTEDEKEQRRVERVLRNRRAAQSSRERKRQEVEALEAEKRAIERRAQDLEMRLADSEAKRAELQSQLEQYTGAMPGMIAFRGSSAPSPAQSEHTQRAPTPITFSQELFSSSDADNRPISTQALAGRPAPTQTQTINLASISPEIRPVDESSNASSSDLTQHPAVSVGRTTALDGYNFTFAPHFGDSTLYDNSLAGYLDLPDSTGADSRFFENEVLPYTDSFDFNNNHLVSHNDGAIDAFNLDDFINQDAQPATEIQSSDSLAEKTPNQQPQFGASSFGCDDGGNAVSV